MTLGCGRMVRFVELQGVSALSRCWPDDRGNLHLAMHSHMYAVCAFTPIRSAAYLPYSLCQCYMSRRWDGDGMVHGVRLDGSAPPSSRSSAAYASAWVDTVRLQKERHAGSPMLYRLGDMAGRRGVAMALLNE